MLDSLGRQVGTVDCNDGQFNKTSNDVVDCNNVHFSETNEYSVDWIDGQFRETSREAADCNDRQLSKTRNMKHFCFVLLPVHD